MNQAWPPDHQQSPNVDSAPDTNNVHVRTYEQDPTYYYPDGNVVFLVGDTLFKVYALLVLPASSILSEAGNARQRSPLGVKDLPEMFTDSSDIHPIALGDITASQFRNYLLAVLGRIYDPEYYSLFTDAKNKDKHSQALLVRFLDITEVSHRLGMHELKEWAFSQLELILESMYKLAESSWDKDTLLRLLSCARLSRRPKFLSSTVNFIQYFISIWTVPEDERIEEQHTSSNLNTCVQLFSDPNLPDDSSVLFGCAFASILALGHRSAVWTSSVTRSQRAILYAAHVQLTASDEGLKSADWLVGEYPRQLVVWTCEQCFTEFRRFWLLTFRKYDDLRSTNPVLGLTALARLPQYRRLFSIKPDSGFPPHWDTLGPLHYSVSYFMKDEQDKMTYSGEYFLPPNLPGDTRTRDRIRCTELEWPLGYLDYCIQPVYHELAERYKSIVSEV